MLQKKITGTVFIITENSAQTQLFANYLAEHTSCEIHVHAPGSPFTTLPSRPVLLVVDSDHIGSDELHPWYETLPAGMADVPIAALNVPHLEQALKVLYCSQLKGIFYRDESLAVICKGIHAMLAGDLWLSRELMTKLILFYRKQQSNAFRPVCGLTNREMDIISLLGTGASNQQIAEKLFVSEHTVKSHLYNIFRKIDVNNRVQALNWIHKNIGPLMHNVEAVRALQ